MNNTIYWNAIVIAILGGWFGLQEFYVGRPICGVFGILLFWTGYPTIVALIEVLVWLFKGEAWFNEHFTALQKLNKK